MNQQLITLDPASGLLPVQEITESKANPVMRIWKNLNDKYHVEM